MVRRWVVRGYVRGVVREGLWINSLIRGRVWEKRIVLCKIILCLCAYNKALGSSPRTFSWSPKSHVLDIHTAVRRHCHPWDWLLGASPQQLRGRRVLLGCGVAQQTPNTMCLPNFRERVWIPNEGMRGCMRGCSKGCVSVCDVSSCVWTSDDFNELKSGYQLKCVKRRDVDA